MPTAAGVLWAVLAAVSFALGLVCLFSGETRIGVAAAFVAVVAVVGLSTCDD